MQNRPDEAEEAYRRALEIEPDYEFAKENLDKLDYWREHPDEKPAVMISSPFEDVRTDITFYHE
jgi:hypothetical protein